MKRRLLLLAVGIASLSAMVTAGAIAIPVGHSDSEPSGTVGIYAPIADVTLDCTAINIPADGVLHKTCDILAESDDTNYPDVRVTSIYFASVSDEYEQVTATCGTIGSNIASETMPQDLPGTPTDIGDLEASIAPLGTNSTCVIGNAVVTIAFEAYTPD